MTACPRRREFATQAGYCQARVAGSAARTRPDPREMVLTGTAGPMRTAGRKATAVVSLLAGGVSLLVAAVPFATAGDRVPLPNLRPDHALQASQSADVTAAMARPPVVATISPDSRFTPDQQIALANINAYFNSFRTMEGEFVQFSPTGEQSEGVFFISRPGRMRFHARPPSRIDVFVNNDSVVIQDNRSMTQDMYPLQKTPFRYLLADQIDLSSEQLVDSVIEEPDLISILITERSRLVPGKLKLTFDPKTYELRQWVVTDAQGLQTAVAIYNVSTGKPQDPSLFRFSLRQTGAGN